MLNLYFFKLKIIPEMNENPKTKPTPVQPMNETTGEKKNKI